MILNRIFGDSGSGEQRAASFGSFMAEIPPPGGSIDMPVGPNNAMQSLAVYACVRILSDAVSTLPVDVYRKAGDAVRQPVSAPKLVSRPWPYLTLQQWLWCVMQSLAIRGNAFLHIQNEDALGYPTSLFPLHPDSVSAIPGEDGDWTRPQYTVGGLRVPADRIVHLRRFPIAGQVLGLSPIEQAAQGVGLSLAAERYGHRYFKDSATPSSVLETDSVLTPDVILNTQKQWISTQGGRRKPAILSGGFKWRPISITPEESQFLATRQFQRGEIAMMFGVPPHMIGDTAKSTSWGSGIESQGIGFVVYTLSPWLKPFEDMWTDNIVRGQYAAFNIDGLLRGDQKARWEAYQLGRNIGVYSVNEIRAKEDLPPVEDGDGRIQAVNYAPLGFDPSDVDVPEPDPEPDPEDPADDPVEDDDEEGDDRGPSWLPDELRNTWTHTSAAERYALQSVAPDVLKSWLWLSDAERQIYIMQADLLRRERRPRGPRTRRTSQPPAVAHKKRRKLARGR